MAMNTNLKLNISIMNYPSFIRQVILLAGLICVFAISSNGQSVSISLTEALTIARKNYAGLARDKLAVNQQSILAQAGLPKQPTQLFISGEEFGANNQMGIHSFNIQQNFYLPRVARAQQEFYNRGAMIAERQLALTDQDLKRQVETSYYQLLFAKHEQELIAENLSLYNDFLTVTTTQLESGETGRIPQMAAISRLGQAQLEYEHASEKHQVALTIFNHWLKSDTTFDVQGELTYDDLILLDSTIINNPHLLIIEAGRDLAIAKIESEKVQLLPQINSGVKLQTASGNFPLFGYQIGANVPLFKKSYRGRIEAAEIEVQIYEADLRNTEQELQRDVIKISQMLKHQVHILQKLEQSLIPLVLEQTDLNFKAYREGEIGYLGYLDSLEQTIHVKQKYMIALYDFNLLRIELDYLLGK